MSQIFISNTTGMDTYVVRRTDLDLDFGSIKRSDVVFNKRRSSDESCTT